MKDIRTMGGLGAILGLLSFIPYVGLVFGIASFVLILLAIQKLSNYFSNKEIFSKYIIGFILSVIGLPLLLFFIIGFIMKPLSNSLSTLVEEVYISFSEGRLLLGGVVLIVLSYLLIIIGMIYWRKSFHLISQFTTIDYFKYVGNLYLWGAITSIILIGGLLFVIAEILLAVAFFSLPDSA